MKKIYTSSIPPRLDTPFMRMYSPNIVIGAVVLGAWRAYCMESWIFRLFVKLGWRK